MRIPYPERIPYPAATCFAAGLLVVQLLEHTDPLFAACCFAYILVATAAFNIAGGLYRPAGAYIFFNAVLTLIVGLVVKACLAEPAQKNLTDSLRFIQVYLLGMVSMLVAAYIENRFRSRRPLLATKLALPDVGSAYKGAVVVGVALTVYFVLPISTRLGNIGGVAISIRNSNFFLPFAIILGVIYTVRSTKGRKSTTGWILLLMVVATAQGLLSFSKQALFTPAFCWLIGAAVSRYKLRPINFVSLALIAYISFSYGNAYSEYGRNFRSADGGYFANAPIAYYLITHPIEMKANSDEVATFEYNRLNYYDRPMGLFDRVQMISIDDALIALTDQSGFFGYEPYKEGIENLVPHFLWKNKPVPYFGNTYMHEIGGMDPNDTSTGVSFSITADAYHEGGLFAVLIVESMSLAAVFLTFSFLAGDVRDNPAVLILILLLAHVGPEGSLYGVFFMISLTIVTVAFAFVCKYILPVAASIFEPQKAADTLLNPAFASE